MNWVNRIEYSNEMQVREGHVEAIDVRGGGGGVGGYEEARNNLITCNRQISMKRKSTWPDGLGYAWTEDVALAYRFTVVPASYRPDGSLNATTFQPQQYGADSKTLGACVVFAWCNILRSAKKKKSTSPHFKNNVRALGSYIKNKTKKTRISNIVYSGTKRNHTASGCRE